MKNKNIFRISVLLYAEKEGIKKRSTIIKKIIEAVFVEVDNIYLTEQEVVNYAESLFEISIFLEEVIEIFEQNKNMRYFEKNIECGEMKYRLTEKRFKTLVDSSQKNIGEYIEEYICEFNVDESIRDVINRFFYRLFINNITDLKEILGKKVETIENINEEFQKEEIEHINAFLEWDNKEKNDSIMALMGYALEYSMLTCDTNKLFGTRLGNIFSSKILYIDTNIIYYCIGINGEEFKKSNQTLLDKCMACREELRITEVTEMEFFNTLDHYIEEIKKFESRSINNINFHKYMSNKDVYLFYLEWRKGRKRFNEPEYFRKYIVDCYNEWLKKYNIKVDRSKPYNEETPDFISKLNQYSQEISYKGKINYDAYNILWVEYLRKKEDTSKSFSEQKYFILSPHRLLKRWDSERDNELSIVLTPTVWMLLLNRFISRSKNDYESFINFINIRTPNEENINNKEFYMIMQAIEEVTTDIEQQESIIDVLVEEKFAYLKRDEEGGISSQEIHDQTVEKGKTILESKVQYLTRKVDFLSTNVEELRLEKGEKEKKVEESDEELYKSKEENVKLREKYVNEKLLSKRIRHGIFFLILNGVVGWQIWDLFINKNSENLYVKTMINLISKTIFDSPQSVEFIFTIGTLIIPFIVCTIDVYLSKIYWDNNYIENFRIKIEKKL